MVKPNGKCYSEKDSQFFKIYVPHHCSHHLRIPPAFIKYFKGVWPSQSILKTYHAKTSWCIDVNKVDNYFFFQKGWPEFVRDNSLEFGDFLIFSYSGNSEFYVPIFGKNNCQKEVPITTRDTDKLQPVLQGSRTIEAIKPGKKMCVDSTAEMDTARMPCEENTGAVGTPCKFGSKNPFFQTILNPTYVKYRFMYIPLEFMQSYMSAHRQTARLKHSNKSWVVTLIRRGKRLVFSRGWFQFVADNTLKEDDVCRFELIRRNDYAFNVVIVRGSRIISPRNKAPGTITTRSSRREEGNKSKEMKGLTSNVGVALEDSSSKFISKHPFFQIVLGPTYVSNGFVNIPSYFRKSYMIKRWTTARLRHSNKGWLVTLKGYGSRGFRFSAGWKKFVKENGLQVGDACSFELIKKDKYVFKVSIARGVNNGKPYKV
ncbi:hypothetical protein LguiB_032498 [Lonicera macranthoides]